MELLLLDASIYAPLVAFTGAKLLNALAQAKSKILILDLTIYEACNAFWKEAAKLNRISPDEALQACKLAHRVARIIEVIPFNRLNPEEAMKIALADNLTFYDAAYIAAAKQLGATLASEDQDIVKNSPKHQVKVIGYHQVLEVLQLSS